MVRISKIFIFLTILLNIFNITQAGSNKSAKNKKNTPIAAHAKATQHERMRLILCMMDDGNTEIEKIARVLQRDFEFSEQCSVSIKKIKNKMPTKKLCQNYVYSENGIKKFPLVLFINAGNNKSIEYRLYDTSRSKMVKGLRYTKRGNSLNGWAHNIADNVWPLLTGCDGCFSTRIAYCKSVTLANGKTAKHVYMAEYDGSNEQCLVALPTVSIAPRWNADTKKPLLFYSEYTNSNVRLVSVDMNKKRHIASNFNGINMLPAFSRDGKKVVYCASRDEGLCQLYYSDAQGVKKLTNNNGNNISPTLSQDGNTVFYCSDAQVGKPQIYSYNLLSNTTERITPGGYCASPSYCQKRKQIAYTKIVSGIMQLFVYDEATQKHTQLTRDAGNKQECSWSTCGNYMVFSVEKKSSSRIAVLNLLTNNIRYITDGTSQCSYPAWSPAYNQFPVVYG